MKIKKFLWKTLLLVWVVAIGIWIWQTFAQFGVTNEWQQFGLAWGTGQGEEMGLIKVVKTVINRVLTLLALIALVLALYGGFQMVTAAGDDGKYKAGFKVLKQAAIGLIVIGLSWIIVTSIFWLIGKSSSTVA